MNHETAVLKSKKLKSKKIAGTPIDFSGVWKNQLGSKMTLAVNGANISGEYESAVSGTGQPTIGELSGFVNGDLISFVVDWQPTPAITAWVGQLVNDNGYDVITTLWQITMNVPDNDEPTGMWQSILAGTDRFHR